MAFGKWCMYLSAVLFLVFGLGALAVVIVPGVDEWATETFFDLLAPTNGEVIESDVSTMRLTSLFLAVVFLPMAGLFVFLGRWFKSMEPSFDSIMDTSAHMARTGAAMNQPPSGVVPGTGFITGVGGPHSNLPPPPG